MNADDPRHGTTAGYHAGCHERCCRRAMARYEKRGRLARLNGGLAVPAIGYQRRVYALMSLGWTSTDIALAAGWTHRNYVMRVVNGQKGKPTTWIERKTAEAIEAAYSKLSMKTPELIPCRARTKARAARLGYAPPLAWTDIDDPTERPVVRRTNAPAIHRERTWDSPDHRACDRCGIVREVNRTNERGRTDLCRDCYEVEAA